MKKITFSIMALAMAAMTFTGCKKENAATQEPEKQAEKTAMTFYAVPQGGERTGLDGALNSIWTEGDQIKIFTQETFATGGDVFTLSKGAGTNYGEFTGKSVESSMYIGAYPASIVSMTNQVLFNLPGTQKYVENSYAPNTVPVLAISNSKNLEFVNVTGLLRVGIKVTSSTIVTSMVLKDKNSDIKLWGTFQTQGATTEQPITYKEDSGGDNTLTMDLGDGVALNTSTYTYFFFCLPVKTPIGGGDDAVTLASGFTIEMEDADGKTATIDYTGTDKKVEQGKGKTLEVPDVEFKEPTTGYADRKEGTGTVKVKWVQLWEDGPKFAEYNVGATTVGEYGGYYAWGGSQSKVDDHYTGGEDIQGGDHDTAKNLWGDNWQMPKKQDFDNLIANCDVVWKSAEESGYGVAGRLYTGKGDYSGNSVFFPAAGFYRNSKVNYAGSNSDSWSSTPCSSNAYLLHFISSGQSVNNSSRNRGQSVRAVLK